MAGVRRDARCEGVRAEIEVEKGLLAEDVGSVRIRWRNGWRGLTMRSLLLHISSSHSLIHILINIARTHPLIQSQNKTLSSYSSKFKHSQIPPGSGEDSYCSGPSITRIQTAYITWFINKFLLQFT